MNTTTTSTVHKPSGAAPRRASVRPRIAALVAVAAAGALVALGAAVPANAATSAQVTASPTSVAVGATTTITATGLGGLETAAFGLDDPGAGTFTESSSASYNAPVDDGTATATFSAAQAGAVTIAVGDGENALGTVQVNITGPTAVVDVQASPSSIQTGQTTSISVTGLGDIPQATFGLSDAAAGTFTENGGSTYAAPVSNGAATATFSASEAGDVTIAVGDGQTVLGTTSITVTATSSQTPPPTPIPASAPTTPSTAALSGIIAGIVVLMAVAAIAGVFVFRARAKRADSGRVRDASAID